MAIVPPGEGVPVIMAKHDARKNGGATAKTATPHTPHAKASVRMPSEISRHRSVFDRIAERVSTFIGRAPFFMVCVLIVVLWAIWGPFAGFSDTWQLVINTGTTIVTFLMVALLQNSTRRSDLAIQHKLNAIADALGDLMHKQNPELEEDIRELHAAVGLEKRESS
jgi:low affinity Fe/Cu permease